MRRGKKKRRPAWDKARAQRAHARRRVRERYDVVLNRTQLQELVRQIQAGQARFVERQSLRVSVFVVHWNGQELPVVYDSQRKTIASVLPPSVLETGQTRRIARHVA